MKSSRNVAYATLVAWRNEYHIKMAYPNWHLSKIPLIMPTQLHVKQLINVWFQNGANGSLFNDLSWTETHERCVKISGLPSLNEALQYVALGSPPNVLKTWNGIKKYRKDLCRKQLTVTNVAKAAGISIDQIKHIFIK